MSATLHQIMCLHRYWITADRMMQDYLRYIGQPWVQEFINKHPGNSPEAKQLVLRVRLFLDPWYACLYVVIEGYRRLRLVHGGTTALLRKREYVDILREYRNASMHYADDYYDERFMAMWERTDVAAWVLEVHFALGQAILEIQRAHPDYRPMPEGSEGQ